MSKLWLTLVTAMSCCAAICQTSDNPVNLPVRDSTLSFLRFTADERNGAALLRWVLSQARPGYYYIVEKSIDGNHFETISAIGSGASSSDTSFSVTDNAVGTGVVYYRIRIAGENSDAIYSKTISTSISAASDFRFYPNPVDKLLIVRSSHMLSIQVMDAYGIVWFSQDVDAGMQIINVSTLQRGNYILKAKDRENGAVISEQLIKN